MVKCPEICRHRGIAKQILTAVNSTMPTRVLLRMWCAIEFIMDEALHFKLNLKGLIFFFTFGTMEGKVATIQFWAGVDGQETGKEAVRDLEQDIALCMSTSRMFQKSLSKIGYWVV